MRWAVGTLRRGPNPHRQSCCKTRAACGLVAPVLLLDGQNVMGDSASDADYLYWLSDYAVTRLHKWP